jgi:hypothetical protein
MMLCDFCSDECDPETNGHTLYVDAISMITPFGVMEYDPYWLACNYCYQIIQLDDRKQLTLRSLNNQGIDDPILSVLMGVLHNKVLESYRGHKHEMHG